MFIPFPESESLRSPDPHPPRVAESLDWHFAIRYGRDAKEL
jgi:hypothetical protein